MFSFLSPFVNIFLISAKSFPMDTGRDEQPETVFSGPTAFTSYSVCDAGRSHDLSGPWLSFPYHKDRNSVPARSDFACFSLGSAFGQIQQEM